MKSSPKRHWLVPLLVFHCGMASNLSAQTLTILHSFSEFICPPCVGNWDGAGPSAALVLSGGTLYATASSGGNSGDGTVFALSTNGTSFTILHTFNLGDAKQPWGELALAGNILYGTTTFGGSSGHGAIFSLKTDGTGFTNLYAFTGSNDGASPLGGLSLSGSTLYGAAKGGGSNYGTVFAINTDGTDFRTLHTFAPGTWTNSVILNADGAGPNTASLLSENTLYGTTTYGGSSGIGTVFRVNAVGTGFTNLYIFSGGDDGGKPLEALILGGNTLYGTTAEGGSLGYGTVFAVNTDGTGFRVIHNFSGGLQGANPQGRLLLSGSLLYGNTGGGYGILFSVNTNGDDFAVLFNFNGDDGGSPLGGLILYNRTLYGTTYGSFTSGTVFSFTLPPPQLTITPAGTNVILTWPADGSSFDLQSITNLASPVWTTNLLAPVIVNGQYTVTNPISGTQQFFRLSQ